MTDPFASALDAIFHGPGSEAAEHQSIFGQVTQGIRVIRTFGDREARFGAGQMIATDHSIQIRMSDVAILAEGDCVTVGQMEGDAFLAGARLLLIGEAMADVEGLTWTIGYEIEDVSR